MGTLIVNQYLKKPWTPADIETVLWLDGADISTITVESGAVSEWRDKSGNGYNPQQASASLRPTYSDGKLTFNGSSHQLTFPESTVSDYPLKMGTDSFEVYAVIDPTVGSATEMFFGARSFSTGWMVGFYLGKPTLRLFDSTEQWSPFPLSVSGSSELQLFHTTAPRGEMGAYRKNDILVETSSSVVGTGSMNVDSIPVRVGAYSSDPSTAFGFFNGDIYEIILIKGVLTDSGTRQKMAGYLAHKWGFTSSLSSDHPYKNNPPYV